MLTPKLFRVCSWVFRGVYPRLPVLGELRSSVALIERQGRFLMQWRSDGLGWAFPGGMAWFWESPEQTLTREVFEETGLRVTQARFRFLYHSRHYIPSRISVFAVETSGEPQSSWEGEVSWQTLAQVEAELFAAHRAIAKFLATSAGS